MKNGEIKTIGDLIKLLKDCDPNDKIKTPNNVFAYVKKDPGSGIINFGISKLENGVIEIE